MWEELNRSLENSGKTMLAIQEGNAELGRFLAGYLVRATRRLVLRLSSAFGSQSRLDKFMGR